MRCTGVRVSNAFFWGLGQGLEEALGNEIELIFHNSSQFTPECIGFVVSL